MTMFSFFVRTGNLIFLLPLLLRSLNESELSVYYLFQIIFGFTTILIHEFGLNFVRTLSFVQGGAKQEDLHDLRNLSEVSSKDEISELSNRVVGTIHRTGIYAAFLILLALLLFGTISLIRPISMLDDALAGWMAWLFFAIVAATKVFGATYGYYLQGLNEVALFRRWEGFILLASLFSSVISLLLGGGLLALIIAQQFVFFIGIFIRRNLAIKSLRREGLAHNKPIFCNDIFKMVCAKTWRTAAGVIMHSGLYRMTGIYYAQIESAEKMASYLLMIKLMNVTVDFSKAPFYSKIPRLSKKAVGNFKDVVSVAQRGMCMSLLVFVAGICFFGLFGETLLALIGSNTKFISVEFWSILGLAYFIERYAAMHLNIYTLSNHIIWHRLYFTSGIIYIISMLILNEQYEFFAFPLAILLSELLFSSWYSVFRSYKLLKVSWFTFERVASLPALLIMCSYLFYVFLNRV